MSTPELFPELFSTAASGGQTPLISSSIEDSKITTAVVDEICCRLTAPPEPLPSDVRLLLEVS